MATKIKVFLNWFSQSFYDNSVLLQIVSLLHTHSIHSFYGKDILPDSQSTQVILVTVSRPLSLAWLGWTEADNQVLGVSPPLLYPVTSLRLFPLVKWRCLYSKTMYSCKGHYTFWKGYKDKYSTNFLYLILIWGFSVPACMPIHFSHVLLCATLSTVACQALSMGFSKEE